MLNVISLSSIKFCLSIYGVFVLFWGYFLIYLLQKVPYFLCKFCLFHALFFFNFVITLKYHSNNFLELKPKDEVTLLSPGAFFWLILECSKLHFLKK